MTAASRVVFYRARMWRVAAIRPGDRLQLEELGARANAHNVVIAKAHDVVSREAYRALQQFADTRCPVTLEALEELVRVGFVVRPVGGELALTDAGAVAVGRVLCERCSSAFPPEERDRRWVDYVCAPCGATLVPPDGAS